MRRTAAEGGAADPRLASAALFADVERLRCQLELTWSGELAALRGLGLADGQAVLDLGCGAGFGLEKLLREFPVSRVVGVDLDPAMAEASRQRVGPLGVGRAEVVCCSAGNLQLPDEAFDVALARLLFQHLAAPEFCAAEAFRVLRPGGTLVVSDVDEALGPIVEPPLASLTHLARKLGERQAGRGGDRAIGRKLWRVLQEAGFGDLRLQVVLVHSAQVGLGPFAPCYEPELLAKSLGEPASSPEIQAYRLELEELLHNPHAFLLHTLLLVSGRKPEEA
ncbi:MAG: methyltransferase domain-containing protein [Chloroflexota bacterium]